MESKSRPVHQKQGNKVNYHVGIIIKTYYYDTNTFELPFLKMLKIAREKLKHEIRIYFALGL